MDVLNNVAYELIKAIQEKGHDVVVRESSSVVVDGVELSSLLVEILADLVEAKL